MKVSENLGLNLSRQIQHAIETGNRSIQVVGTDSSLTLAATVAEQILNSVPGPHLVLVPDLAQAQDFEKDFLLFCPHARVHFLPAFDVSPYSGLYANPDLIARRVSWCHWAQQNPSDAVFVAKATSLFQPTLAPDELKSRQFTLSVGDELTGDFQARLAELGYRSVPMVEDIGSYSWRGGLLDIFSAAHEAPVRIELFGDFIESIRLFSPETQMSLSQTTEVHIIPTQEVFFKDDRRMAVVSRFREDVLSRGVPEEEYGSALQSLIHGQYFQGLEFLLPLFEERFYWPLEHFSEKVRLWIRNPIEVSQHLDEVLSHRKEEFESSNEMVLRPPVEGLLKSFDELPVDFVGSEVRFSKVELRDLSGEFSEDQLTYATYAPVVGPAGADPEGLIGKIKQWRSESYAVFVSCPSSQHMQRLKLLLERHELDPHFISEEEDLLWQEWRDAQAASQRIIHVHPYPISESQRLPEDRIVFLTDDDFFGKRQRVRKQRSSGSLAKRADALTFSDLKVGDNIVHVLHGVGTYEGLKVMPIQGVETEFLELRYKDGDRLYLPIYRIGQIQKYSGGVTRVLDKLGGPGWEKAKSRVKKRLREIAGELLQLYAQRKQSSRPPFKIDETDYNRFADQFPYEETEDQLRAIEDVFRDMQTDQPMDRLVCGDVGFGKTEVAMRAAFVAASNGKQVAVVAPTTILTFQHKETFQKRFKGWPFEIRVLNRFLTTKEAKEVLEELRQGKVDIIIGTHRLLSKDVHFKDLGLLVIDEEQKFGVTHKEKIRHLKVSVDTLAMTATPIPRTLNMSLLGIRDLSIINTAPVDRLPTRTFVTRFNKDTIRKAILSEVERGGQVYFLHNRVQTIYNLSSELRELLPEVRLAVGHGQLPERELETTMISFFKGDVDVLICTTIIESGMDIPRANTMFIDNAQNFGLSQLYQLRGRVGRSKQRAYCYLLVPTQKKLDADAQERLKVIQDHTALGSGILIAQHDLELRGAGTLLGEEQSGHIDAVGHEMFMDLLQETMREMRGEKITQEVEPEINLRIPALIPSQYIGDIRMRLAFYKRMSDIEHPSDLDQIEDELRDQFGKPPAEVTNLFGVMLIRWTCKTLGIRDLSAGQKSVSLSFTPETPLPPDQVVQLATREPRKYNLTPDMRLNIRMEEIAWPNVYDELVKLKSLCS